MSKARDLADLGGVTTRLDEVGNSDGALSNRNLLINSGFLVNQRGVTSTTGVSGSSKFLADRWITYCNGSDWSASIQEVTLPDGTVANSLKTVATASAVSGFFHPFQKVEALGKDYLQGKKVVLSAWVRTNVAGQFIRICDTVSCYLLGTQIPADGQWHKVSTVHTMPTSMNTGASDQIQFHPLFNNVDLAAGDYCEFALPQMELGDTATPFEHRSYGDQLQSCMRYYSVIGGGSYVGIDVGQQFGTTGSIHGVQYPAPMRAAPSVSFDNLIATDRVVFDETITGFSAVTAGDKSAYIRTVWSTVRGSRGDAVLLAIRNGYAGGIKFDAEL